MKARPSYWRAAFNARPFGMAIPPNWFGVAAFALLGAVLNPGLWLIGMGLEGLYLWMLTSNTRFRNAVDATQPDAINWQQRYAALAANLDRDSLATQSNIEQQANEITALLARVGANESQIADVRHMTWLHLKLLSARTAMQEVISVASRAGSDLETHERHLKERLGESGIDEELRRSLSRQLEVIQLRRAAHIDADKRLELVDAELDRLRQQISLVREQALLATDEQSVAQSLDALSASLNEANRWLKDQRELFAGLADLGDEAPPANLFKTSDRTASEKKATTRGRVNE